MIVVDASAVVEVLLLRPAAQQIERRWLADRDLHAPQILDLEILQALRRMVREREIDDDRACAAAQDLEALRIRRWAHVPLRQRVWDLRSNLTAYDAVYVALAERFRCGLVTCDARLARAPGHLARIELFGREG